MGRWVLCALVCLLLAFHPQQVAAQGTHKVSDEARALFREGVALLKKQGDYVSAYAKFKAAYADSPSPKILGNLGLCALKLERFGEARDAYTEYLASAPGVSKAERAEIERELSEMERVGATVEIIASTKNVAIRDERTTKDGKIVVNEYSAGDGRITVFLRAGKHRFAVRARERVPSRVEIEIAGGEQETLKVTLRKKQDDSVLDVKVDDEPDAVTDEGVGTAFWVMLGVTGAAGVAAGVMGGLTIRKHGQFDDAQAAGDDARALELHDQGRTFSITTDVLLGVTGAAAIVTTVLLITGLSGGDDEADAMFTPNGIGVRF